MSIKLTDDERAVANAFGETEQQAIHRKIDEFVANDMRAEAERIVTDINDPSGLTTEERELANKFGMPLEKMLVEKRASIAREAATRRERGL